MDNRPQFREVNPVVVVNQHMSQTDNVFPVYIGVSLTEFFSQFIGGLTNHLDVVDYSMTQHLVTNKVVKRQPLRNSFTLSMASMMCSSLFLSRIASLINQFLVSIGGLFGERQQSAVGHEVYLFA